MKTVMVNDDRVTINANTEAHTALKLYSQKNGFRTLSEAILHLIREVDPQIADATNQVMTLLREATGGNVAMKDALPGNRRGRKLLLNEIENEMLETVGGGGESVVKDQMDSDSDSDSE